MKTETLRKSIINYLNDKGNYISSIDELDIETLIDNYEIAQTSLMELKENGPVLTIPNGNGIPTTKQSPYLTSYQSSIKMVRESALKLGLSRQDRIKLKIEEKQDKSKLSNLMNRTNG